MSSRCILIIGLRNAPYILGTRSVALPLAAGNTAILKGSELSPRCFWAIGDIFREAGLPAGCLNVLYHQTSHASAVTTALIAHPAVRKISFTGSTAVGGIVASTAGRYVKPVLLELGGKASAIVLDDANLEKAATCCALGAFMHVRYHSFPGDSMILIPVLVGSSLHVYRAYCCRAICRAAISSIAGRGIGEDLWPACGSAGACGVCCGPKEQAPGDRRAGQRGRCCLW